SRSTFQGLPRCPARGTGHGTAGWFCDNDRRSGKMGVAAYDIVPRNDGWAVAHDGDLSMSYLTKEAAFEAATAAASLALREGHEIRLHVPARDGNEPALGRR